MKRQAKEYAASLRVISRRTAMLGALQAGVIGVLGWRMRQLQVDQADQFRLLADENRINIRLLAPARGKVFDYRGNVLADNEQTYRVVMVREDAGDVDEALYRLSQIIPLTPEDRVRTADEVMKRSAFVPVTIADRLTFEEVSRVALNTPTLPGILPDVGLSRHYPNGADFAHVVGYVGPVSDYDLSKIEDPDPLLQIPKFQIGKTGIESKLEPVLRGAAGFKQVEVNALGREMRELTRQEGEPGSDVQLTIDAPLQSYAEARLEGQSAAAVVIDIATGDVRVAASAPGFDPNLFVRGISVADWNALNENPYRPLATKTVQGAYPPGSTFKMVTALAALEAGVLDPQEHIYCGGYREVSGIRFHCWKPGGHGNVTLNQSLEQSCDVFYYEVAQRVGIDNISVMARRMGLGDRYDLPLSAVAAGLVPDREWKARVHGQDWLVGDTINASIGQGFVLTTPMQLAVMTARLASGRAVEPRLVHKIAGVEQPYAEAPDLGLSENDLRRVRQGLIDVVNSNRGTAFGSRTVEPEYTIAGKTGTSQVRRITQAEREAGITSNEDLPWERRDHALFVAYAPADNPKYAIAVVVEHGGGGSAAAAPIARDILLQAFYDGPPPLSAYPAAVRGTVEEQQKRIEERNRAVAAAQSRA